MENLEPKVIPSSSIKNEIDTCHRAVRRRLVRGDLHGALLALGGQMALENVVHVEQARAQRQESWAAKCAEDKRARDLRRLKRDAARATKATDDVEPGSGAVAC